VTEGLTHLVRAAGAAANAGRWDEAERLWTQVRQRDPNHPDALYSLGVHAFQRGDLGGAIALLAQAADAAPTNPTVRLTLSVAYREKGDADAEWSAILAALTVNPYFLPGLLAKAEWLERWGRIKLAAEVYGHVLKIAPIHWPDHLKGQLTHARKIVDQHQQAFAAHLERQLSLPLAAISQARASRWSEAAAIMVGRSEAYRSQSNQLSVPRLPAIPFFDRKQFAWAEAIEAQTDAIRTELTAVLADDREDFSPYIAYRPGDPVNQWAELNHSDRWSTYSLWRHGVPDQDHLSRCPKTVAALNEAQLVHMDGICPNVMFSALAPKTHIPPHHGETNARLVVHLPLIVPDHCQFRVGFERRNWRVGELLIFDDTIEHEARNDSDQLRVVLIFDIWNPYLSVEERELVSIMMAAKNAFMAS